MKTKFKLNILTKLIIGFGVIIISFLISYAYIYKMLENNKKLTKTVNEVVVPSMSTLNKLSSSVFESKHLLKNWVLFEKKSNTPKKLRLLKINQKNYIETKYELKQLSKDWSQEEIQTLNQIFSLADSWFSQQKDIMKRLNSPSKYESEDYQEKFVTIVQEGGPLMDLADNIKIQIDNMYSAKKDILLDYNIKMENSLKTFTNSIVFSGIILIVMVLLIAFLFINSMLSPLNNIRKIVLSMSKGKLPENKIPISTDEIGQMGQALNNLIIGLKEKSNFAQEIESGKYKGDFKISGKDDILGNSLLAMRNSLAEATKHESIRHKENEERSWITQGISEFNEIVREHNGTQEEFGLIAINKLTRYINAQVGGLYIISHEEEGTVLELIAFYAYDRHKFFEQRILPGQNLVGQCYLEKDTIFLTDIPKAYIKISSGLGKEDAKSILIVPLIVNEKIYGIIELASLNIFEAYQIEFIEKVSEVFASTISTIQTNMQTSGLLEELQEKTEVFEMKEKENLELIDNLNLKVKKLTDEILKLHNKE